MAGKAGHPRLSLRSGHKRRRSLSQLARAAPPLTSFLDKEKALAQVHIPDSTGPKML